MPFWYFFPVPKLPPEVSHQSNVFEIRKYLASEGSAVDVGTPIASVENYWAVVTLKSNGKGILMKTIFDRGTSVKIGDPIAVIGSDGENIPYGKEHASIEITELKREKLSSKHEST
ncbi:MAG TPA: biotin/lipoyl-containing protein [Chthoniobacterales bacterium]|nr:biotin/lipoyl-containing protein [Chthoniobacterales bacterium]